MKSLLDSVFHGYPIGSILVWDSDREISSLDYVGPIRIGPAPKGVVSYILDGHQRISTLLGTLMLPHDAPSTNDDVDWRLYFDLEQYEFIHAPKEGLQPWYFPVRSLLETTDFFQAARVLQDDVEDSKRATRLLKAADYLANAIRNYQLPLISITEASLDSAVTVFARLNRRGRKMTADQMVSALTYREGSFHLADRLDTFQQELAHRGFGKLERIFLLRTVLAAMDLDIYARDFAAILVREEIRAQLPEKINIIEESLNRALDFLEGIGVTSDRLLPYGLQLVLLAEYFRLRHDPPSEHLGLLKRWFWVTSFTGWFGMSNPTLARRALDEMREFARGQKSRFEAVDLESVAQPFPLRFDGRSARVRAFLLYLSSLNPRSVYEKGDLSTGALLSELGTHALSRIVGSGLPPELSSSPANRMFADRDHRGQVVGVLESLVQGGRSGGILASHGFPSEAQAQLAAGDREGAISSRLAYLIEGERAFMADRSVRCPVARTALAVRDSDASEDE
jgi:hypothetical protein